MKDYKGKTSKMEGVWNTDSLLKVVREEIHVG